MVAEALHKQFIPSDIAVVDASVQGTQVVPLRKLVVEHLHFPSLTSKVDDET